MNDENLSELLARLREGKRELRERRRAMSLPEKVRQVVALQKIALPLIARRPWERVWPLDER